MATSNDATTKNNKNKLKQMKAKGTFKDKDEKKKPKKAGKFLQGGQSQAQI
jgi:hypothetical protein